MPFNKGLKKKIIEVSFVGSDIFSAKKSMESDLLPFMTTSSIKSINNSFLVFSTH